MKKGIVKRWGELTSKVTRIKKYILGIPVKTLHKYRKTYDGEVKSCEDCNVSV